MALAHQFSVQRKEPKEPNVVTPSRSRKEVACRVDDDVLVLPPYSKALTGALFNPASAPPPERFGWRAVPARRTEEVSAPIRRQPSTSVSG